MNSKYHHSNFYVCPTSSSDLDILRRLPLFFTDLKYEETETGFFGILYRSDLDHRQCMNSYLDDQIEHIRLEFEKYHQFRKRISKKVEDRLENLCFEMFEEHKLNYFDNFAIMMMSMYDVEDKPEKDTQDQIL